jgi:tRNA pseudouridine65 synthase/23S rRNA pseudouridine1911/1915/1917 synthase
MVQKIVLSDLDKTYRLSELPISFLPEILSKSKWKKLIAKNLVKLNGKIGRTSDWVKSKDIIEYELITHKSKIFPLSLTVEYEDEYLAIIYKPAGYPVSGNYFKTIQNALAFNLKISSVMKSSDEFKPCHRLDRATSGLLLISKTEETRILIGELFENKEIQKQYYALCQGNFTTTEGIWNSKIEDKDSMSSFRVLKSFDTLTFEKIHLLKLEPITGRTHQLRIHSSLNGTPILGDPLYNNKNTVNHKGLFLHAYSIDFCHPITGKKILIKTKIPQKFDSFMSREHRRFLKYNQ